MGVEFRVPVSLHDFIVASSFGIVHVGKAAAISELATVEVECTAGSVLPVLFDGSGCLVPCFTVLVFVFQARDFEFQSCDPGVLPSDMGKFLWDAAWRGSWLSLRGLRLVGRRCVVSTSAAVTPGHAGAGRGVFEHRGFLKVSALGSSLYDVLSTSSASASVPAATAFLFIEHEVRIEQRVA